MTAAPSPADVRAATTCIWCGSRRESGHDFRRCDERARTSEQLVAHARSIGWDVTPAVQVKITDLAAHLRSLRLDSLERRATGGRPRLAESDVRRIGQLVIDLGPLVSA